ncbi:hypothetical protein GGE45_003913 [Rhizobium aethiopicum]|uniref:hypothetical protein n=1 Tax=Rhizobium aethiopicum TaxID=1138170 RepID=UPI00161ACC57|nr:hypothetical protein [Rhizobium aethiopicum]MBB4581565.1 hypothetical protein [Rhizobium aethiopicum]
MTPPAALKARLQFLDDTLRQRFPGFTDDSTDVAGDPQPSDPRRLPAHSLLEQAIGKIVAKRIPAHPAYNRLVLATLKVYRTNNIAAMDPVADRARLISIINVAHKMRPIFPRSYDRDDFLHLHTLLNDYSKIEGGNLRQFPSIETLGYRRDEAGLRRFDHGQTVERAPGKINLRYAAGEFREQNIPFPEDGGHREDGARAPADVWVDKPEGWIGKQPLRRQQLQALNRFVDTLCPPGKYFNGMRMQLIHQVWSNRQFFEDYKSAHERNENKGWVEPGYGVKNGRIVERQFVWMPEDKWQPMKEFVDGMNQMLEDTRKRLKTSAGRYPQPLTPEEAIKVDRLVRQHARLSERHAEGRPERSTPSIGHIPEGIKRAVTRPHNPVRSNPVARQWAERCAETIEEIVPFKNRKTLERRLQLRDLVYSSRDDLLKSGAGRPAAAVDEGDVSDVSDAEDNGGRVHPLTVADLGDPIRDDEITQMRFNKLLKAGKIRYAEQVSIKYEQLTRVYFRQFKDRREVIDRLARELNSFDDAWTGKLREPPPPTEAALPASGVKPAAGKPRKAAEAFQTKDLIAAARDPAQQKLPFRPAGAAREDEWERSDSGDEEFYSAPTSPLFVDEDTPMGGMEERVRTLKRRSCDHADGAETTPSPEASLPRENALADSGGRPAKRGRVGERSDDRSRSRSRG